MKMLTYKGYSGSISVDIEGGILHGEVIGIRDVITYEAETVTGLIEAFHESLDDYLAFCVERGESPDKPYSGKLLVRVSPDVHRALVARAKDKGQSVNALAVRALKKAAAIS
jgi:predicted HicB family RNase H-like nuclease